MAELSRESSQARQHKYKKNQRGGAGGAEGSEAETGASGGGPVVSGSSALAWTSQFGSVTSLLVANTPNASSSTTAAAPSRFTGGSAAAPGTLSAVFAAPSASASTAKQVPRMGTQGSGRTPPGAPQLTSELVFASVPSHSHVHPRPPLPISSTAALQQYTHQLQSHALVSTSTTSGAANGQQHKWSSTFVPPPLLASSSVPDLISAQTRGSERQSGRSRDDSSTSPDVEVVTSVLISVITWLLSSHI